jgi:membrane protein implicated in regulation of membrane protease activity
MYEDLWLSILGLILIITELLFGAISGFDLALVGLSLVIGGFVQYLTGSWQAGVTASIVIIIIYFIFIRKYAKKKLLVATQKIGIDSLLGKVAVVVDSITKNKPGKVLVDGEVWRAQSSKSIAENEEVVIIKIEGVTLEVETVKPL